MVISSAIAGDVSESPQQAFSRGLGGGTFWVASVQALQRFGLLTELAPRHEFEQGQGAQGNDQDAHQTSDALVGTQQQGPDRQCRALEAMKAAFRLPFFPIAGERRIQVKAFDRGVGSVEPPTGQLVEEVNGVVVAQHLQLPGGGRHQFIRTIRAMAAALR